MTSNQLKFIDEVSSTNSFLKNEVKTKQITSKMGVFATFQFEGKGQYSNTWAAEKGKNILCSFLVHKQLGTYKPETLNNAATLAVFNLLETSGLENIKIKWPNDIYIKDKKIAGILVENSFIGSVLEYSIIGIGVNINQTNFSGFEATSTLNETGIELDLQTLSLKLYDNVYRLINLLPRNLLNRINNVLYKKGENVTFSAEEGIRNGVVSQILPNGNLEVIEGMQVLELKHHINKWIK